MRRVGVLATIVAALWLGTVIPAHAAPPLTGQDRVNAHLAVEAATRCGLGYNLLVRDLRAVLARYGPHARAWADAQALHPLCIPVYLVAALNKPPHWAQRIKHITEWVNTMNATWDYVVLLVSPSTTAANFKQVGRRARAQLSLLMTQTKQARSDLHYIAVTYGIT